ncbi:MAG TPA: hypothetical protein VIM11_01780 [Tepidisphaeraceae bacterium]|jgi:hypothetical protein
MNVPLSTEVLEQLRQEASRRGIAPEDYARQLIEERLSDPTIERGNRATLALLDQWDLDDETNDPAELERRRQDFEEFKEVINASHSSDRKIFPGIV